MDKAKEDRILEVALSPVHPHRPFLLDPSQAHHRRPTHPIQEQHPGSSHLNQMRRISLDPMQGPPLDSSQMLHTLRDPIQEPLLDSSLHQMPNTLQYPTQGLQLGQTLKHRMLLIQELLLAHSNQEPHLAPIQALHLVLIQESHPARSNQELLLVPIQEPHLVPIQEPQLARSNQELQLAPIQEPQLARSNQELQLAPIQEPPLARSNQELQLAPIQEPQPAPIQEPQLARSNQELHLANSNQGHLGNIPIPQGRWDLVGCQVHIPTLLGSHIQILLDLIRLHLGLMASLVLQVLPPVGQGGLLEPRVGSTPHSLICRIHLILHSQLLVLVPHRLYPGAPCHPVSGGRRHHFLEPLGHTQIEVTPEVAGSSGPVLGALSPSLSHPTEDPLENDP
ncbi:uncharacterized protein ACMZJ9_020216 isoform 3-T3 [Mantella aurantiaca]